MPAPYTLRLGPLQFTSPLDAITKTLGEALDNVGAVVTPAERRPRPLKLKVPVEAAVAEADTKAVGDRMRRQVEQLLENRRWLAQGLYLRWSVEDLVAAWVVLGGSDLTETDPGISFGSFDLELSDLYIVGAPGTHRAGRRLDLSDRRTGLVPRDTRGLIYSNDFADQDLPTHPLFLPGDITQPVSSARVDRDLINGPGNWADGRLRWKRAEAIDGEVITYLPNPAGGFDGILADRLEAPTILDEAGSVRAFDMNLPSAVGGDWTTFDGFGPFDQHPDGAAPFDGYGWERLYGQPQRSDRFITLDNGSVRVRWLGGNTETQGLLFDTWDALENRYVAQARFLHAVSLFTFNGEYEIRLIELTPERGVLEVRLGPAVLRVILQRGWTGIRLESYQEHAGTTLAHLDYQPINDPHVVGLSPYVGFGFEFDAYPYTITNGREDTTGTDSYFAPAVDGYDAVNNVGFFGVPNLKFTPNVGSVALGAPNAVVMQFGMAVFQPGAEADLTTAAEIGALGLVDARSVPVLVSRV